MINTLKAIEAFRKGQFVIVMDDYNRENEGDLICCAQTMTKEQMVFMLNHTTGIVCIAMKAERLRELELPMMVENNTDPKKTPFTVTVDLLPFITSDSNSRDSLDDSKTVKISTGMTTGVSAHDRTLTVRALTNDKYKSTDFNRPGHMFPLRYTEGGLFARRGHTEAAIDLCRITGLYPAGVLCELQNEDGTMSRLKDCTAFSKQYNIPIISIQEIVDHMTNFPPDQTALIDGKHATINCVNEKVKILSRL